MARAGEGGSSPAMGEQDAADCSLYFRLGTAIPSELAAGASWLLGAVGSDCGAGTAWNRKKRGMFKILSLKVLQEEEKKRNVEGDITTF
jgi:hypothetical protein